jgi:hypothetical protein
MLTSFQSRISHLLHPFKKAEKLHTENFFPVLSDSYMKWGGPSFQSWPENDGLEFFVDFPSRIWQLSAEMSCNRFHQHPF